MRIYFILFFSIELHSLIHIFGIHLQFDALWWKIVFLPCLFVTNLEKRVLIYELKDINLIQISLKLQDQEEYGDP